MATRSRTRRAEAEPVASTAPVVTRRSRRRAQPDLAPINPSNGPSASAPSNAALPLVALKPPRRGAPKWSPPGSVVSFNPPPRNSDDEDEDSEDEEDEENEGSVTQAAEPAPAATTPSPLQTGEPPEDAQSQVSGSQEKSEEQLQIMALSLHDLEHSARELISLLRNQTLKQAVLKRLWVMKERVFVGVRELYDDAEKASPYLDWTETAHLNQLVADRAASAKSKFVLANLTTTMAICARHRLGEEFDALSIFAAIGDAFPTLFQGHAGGLESAELSVDIRTRLAIEVFRNSSMHDNALNEALAFIFCADVGPAPVYRRIFSHGPFKPLRARAQATDAEIDKCGDRLVTVQRAVGKDKDKDSLLRKLEEAFPMQAVMRKLEDWITATVDDLGPQLAASNSDSAANHPDAEFVNAPSSDFGGSQAESQPIQRIVESQQHHSMFQGKQSFAALEQACQREPAPPSAQQQQGAPPPDAPSDYGDDSESRILGDAVSEAPSAPRSQSLKRARPVENGDDDDESEDGDDEFQTDERAVDEVKAAQLKAARNAKRQKLDDARRDSQRMPPPALPSSSSQRIPSSQRISSAIASSAPLNPNLAAIRATIDRASQSNRAVAMAPTQTPASSALSGTHSPYRQRVPWSTHDTELLISLVAKRRGRWADMQRADAHDFDEPRNQQAYRDKARNLKVDFLLADAVLPPAFDHVALGKKEMARVRSFGKNPHRRERDVDEDGRAIDTELPAYEFSSSA